MGLNYRFLHEITPEVKIYDIWKKVHLFWLYCLIATFEKFENASVITSLPYWMFIICKAIKTEVLKISWTYGLCPQENSIICENTCIKHSNCLSLILNCSFKKSIQQH